MKKPTVALLLLASAAPAAAQIDSARAQSWFQEAAALCAREGGRLWGRSLCGPMVIADPQTKTIATNQPAPTAPRPTALGYANSALRWGEERWSTFVWAMIPRDDAHARAVLLLHELYHRIQPELGLFLNDGQNEHLDTPDGRFWLQLEWRALAAALGSSGAQRSAALRDALAFRARRHASFAGAAENERTLEINEGLAQYTGTVAAVASHAEAVADAIAQLGKVQLQPTLVRSFPYPQGAAYGVLLDAYAPGWSRGVKPTDDLGALLRAATRLEPAADPEAAAARYGGAELKLSEAVREEQRQRKLAELRKRFIEGPVLVLPNGKMNSFSTVGMMPIPGEGTVYPTFRTSGDWGSLEAASVLMAFDWSKLTLPAPTKVEGRMLTGDGWTLTLAEGWAMVPGSRQGDFKLVRQP